MNYRLFFNVLGFVLLSTFFGAVSFAADPYNSSPYGTCAHLVGGMEFDALPTNLQVMRKAGIRWARADFSWSSIERGKGNWYFEHLDRVLNEADKAGITVLPILNYDVPWASPAYKHLDEWSEYVRRVVTRYKDRVRYWEVWNEENLRGFWRDDPTGESYTILLKRTFEIIKGIDPDLQVVYGGLAGVPANYYEDSLKAGAGKYFDIMNIHPYRGGLISTASMKAFERDIKKFKELTKQYTGDDRPLWITEMGWATPPKFGESGVRVVQASLNILYPNGLKGSVALLVDPKYDPGVSGAFAVMKSVVPQGVQAEAVLLSGLPNLSVEKYPALVLPMGEVFPTPYYNDLQEYVKRGGTLFLLGGVPIYYQTAWQDGVLTRDGRGCPETMRRGLRIGWSSWWTVKGVPEKAPLFVSKEAQPFLAGYQPVLEATRFLTSDQLKDGDRFISILDAKTKDFSASGAAIFDFNSDWTGAVVVSMIMDAQNTNVCEEANQGVFLPQAYLTALACGIDRFFWYEFQAVERDDVDKEHHFGMVHRDLTPKSGYLAYKAMTKARPEGSIQTFGWQNGDNGSRISWIRPDGKKGWAVWTTGASQNVPCKISGKIDESFDYLGNPVTLNPADGCLPLSLNVLYLIGPDNVELAP